MNKQRFSIALACVLAVAVGWGAAELQNRPSLPDLGQPNLTQAPPVPVIRVIDGDTIVVTLEGKPATVRLIGVDTPETVHPTQPVQAYGKEASRFTDNLLRGEQVYLLFDQQRTDRYGRILAYVYRAPDGLFVNAEIVRQGYGHAYTQFPFKYLEQFRQLEQFARSAEKGLWAPEAAPTVATVSTGESAVVNPAAVVAPAPPATPAVDPTVYVTRTGTKYHRAGCRYLTKSQIPMKLSEAKKRYTPCSVCNP